MNSAVQQFAFVSMRKHDVFKEGNVEEKIAYVLSPHVMMHRNCQGHDFHTKASTEAPRNHLRTQSICQPTKGCLARQTTPYPNGMEPANGSEDRPVVLESGCWCRGAQHAKSRHTYRTLMDVFGRTFRGKKRKNDAITCQYMNGRIKNGKEEF